MIYTRPETDWILHGLPSILTILDSKPSNDFPVIMFIVLNSLIHTADLRRPPWLSPLSGRSLGRTTCGQARRKAERPFICSNDQHGIISILYLSFHSTVVVSKIQNRPFVPFGPHAASCIGPASIFGANTSR